MEEKALSNAAYSWQTSFVGPVMVYDCWSCALITAAPYGIVAVQLKHGALDYFHFIPKHLPDVGFGKRRLAILDVGSSKLLMEFHCALQPRGYFVWSATPVYQKLHEDVGVWITMSGFTKSVCCGLLGIITDEPKQLIAATGGTPSMKECYNEQELTEPPNCNTAAYPLYDDCYILVLISNDKLSIWVATVSSCLFHVLLFLMGIFYQSTTTAQRVSLPIAVVWNCLLIPGFKFIFITSGQTDSLLSHASLHSALWSALIYKDIALLRTHSTIITTIVLGVILHNAEGYTPAIFLPRSFSMAELVDFLNGSYQFYCLRYFTTPLLSRDNCVGSVTPMHIYFQGVVLVLALQCESSMATYCSTIDSPSAALMRNLFSSSSMDAIQLLLSLLANILRDDDSYISEILVLRPIIQPVSLQSMQHGLSISYGDIPNGNFIYHLSCSIYFPDFVTTWFIQFVCGKPVASVAFYVKMHGIGTSPFMWVLGSIITLLVYHIDNQLVGWHLVVKVFETPKGNALKSRVAATTKWSVDALTTSETSVIAIDDLTVSTTQGRGRKFMQLRSHYFELLEFVHSPQHSSPSTSSLLQLLSQRQTHVVLPFHYMLILLLVLLDAYVDCRYPATLGSEETSTRTSIIKVPQKVNDSVAEGVLQCLAATLMQYLLVFGYQRLAVLMKLNYVPLCSSSDSSEEIPVGVHKCFRVLLQHFFACSATSWTCDYMLETGPQSFVADRNSIVANEKQLQALTVLKVTDGEAEANPSAGPGSFHLMCNKNREVKTPISYSTTTTSMKAFEQPVELLLKTFKLPTGAHGDQILKFSSLRTSLFSRGGGLVRINSRP